MPSGTASPVDRKGKSWSITSYSRCFQATRLLRMRPMDYFRLESILMTGVSKVHRSSRKAAMHWNCPSRGDASGERSAGDCATPRIAPTAAGETVGTH